MAYSKVRINEVVEVYKAVSDPTRMAAVLVLDDAGAAGVNVTDLRKILKTPTQPMLSHHLALLRSGRLAACERDGKNNVYRLTERGRRVAAAARALAPGLAPEKAAAGGA